MRISPLNLRAKVSLAVIVPLTIILAVIASIESRHHRTVLLSNLSGFAMQSGELLEESLRHQMAESDFDGVQSLLDQVAQHEEFRNAYLIDTAGIITFAPYQINVGRQLDENHPNCQSCHSLAPADRPTNIVVTSSSGEPLLRSIYPIENGPNCVKCHDDKQRLNGLLLVDISLASLDATLAEDLRVHLYWWVITTIIIIIIVNIIVDRLILHRLSWLNHAMSLFGLQGQTLLLTNHNNADEIGQLVTTFQKMAQQIKERDEENQTLTNRLHRQSSERGKLLRRLITAQENERKRVARELHDDLGQVFGALSLRIEAMKHASHAHPNNSPDYIAQTHELISYGTERMYDLILALRPSALDDLGLAPALRINAERVLDPNNISYTLDAKELYDRLPPAVEVSLYRVFQEAMSNIIRHANATTVHMSLACHQGAFRGEIRDNGLGFNLADIPMNGEEPRGLGLMGMRERISQCGGELHIDSSPTHGTCIRMTIPLEVFCE